MSGKDKEIDENPAPGPSIPPKGEEKLPTEINKKNTEGEFEEAEELLTGTLDEEEAAEEEEVKKRIVVVDSQEKTLDKTISALRKGEYKVIGVESAKEFFEVTEGKSLDHTKIEIPDEYYEAISSGLPDLIITDLDLKDLDGWEFIFQLKFENRYYEYREVPILVFTNEPVTPETPKKIQAESIHDYIPKAIKGEELLEKVNRYFELREKLEARKMKFKDAVGYRVAAEYERITLARRIRLKYLGALTSSLEALKNGGGDPAQIKSLEDIIYNEKRNLIKYERRRMEIKKLVKSKVKEDDGGTRTEAKAEAD